MWRDAHEVAELVRSVESYVRSMLRARCGGGREHAERIARQHNASLVSDDLEIELTRETLAKLDRLAAFAGVTREAAASALLMRAIDAAEPDSDAIVGLLDRIPGGWERIQDGIDDARSNRTTGQL
jgi:hypothetical protein